MNQVAEYFMRFGYDLTSPLSIFALIDLALLVLIIWIAKKRKK